MSHETDNHGRIVDAVSISERPATVEDRPIPGRWDTETVVELTVITTVFEFSPRLQPPLKTVLFVAYEGGGLRDFSGAMAGASTRSQAIPVVKLLHPVGVDLFRLRHAVQTLPLLR